MANNVRIMSNVSLNGTLSFESNYTGFPTNPAPRTMIVKDGVPYLYTELVNGSGYYTWTPIGSRQSAHLHTQGVASSEWTVTHNFQTENFGYFVYDQDHNLVLANTQIIDPNTVKVLLTSANTGTAVFFSMESIFTQMVTASNSVQISSITLRDASGVLTVNNNPVAMAEAVANSFAQVYTKAQTDGAIIDAVAVETQARMAADHSLTVRIDNVLANIDPSALDSLNEVVTAFNSADNDLSSAITNVLGRHTSELAAEIQDRIEADTTNLAVAKDYADDAVVVEADARVAGDLTTLNAAKTYTDTSIQTLAQGTVEKANRLATPRTINGIAFDGSTDIRFSTDQVGEGTYNKYYTDSRARNAISVTGTATYDAATGVLNVTNAVSSVAGRTGAVLLNKADVGLANVDNTSDANKPVSTAQSAAISAAQSAAISASAPAAHVGSGGDAHSSATTSVAGFMSASDKTKLDSISGTVLTATNVKTINGNSIFGTGDIAISGGSGGSSTSNNVGTIYNPVSRYLATNAAGAAVWIVSSSKVHHTLSWYRGGTALTVTKDNHRLVVGDQVIVRNTNVDVLAAKVTSVSATTFTIICDDTGPTSGTNGAYSVGFKFAHNTTSLVTGGTLSAPVDSTDLVISSLKFWFPLNSRTGSTYTITMPKNVNGLGIEVGADPDAYANFNLPTMVCRQGVTNMTIVGASLAGAAANAGTTNTLTVGALGTSSSTSTMLSLIF
ncbi:hypothetical protein UFOVP116_7 [uncultured Caudovirales phage]|uniref:Uncharacterized protein n=1 Tax=uncultured Caudovirales phage TaxID=2100421 RepID=A0A6J5L874_9CAUD|nr:hypothetical protein UFOVP116_7 [uncultured Caudovirales phage]